MEIMFVLSWGKTRSAWTAVPHVGAWRQEGRQGGSRVRGVKRGIAVG